MKQPSKDLTQGSLWKNIFVFSIPLMLSNVLQVLFNMSDIAVVGRFAGPLALGSVGSTAILVTMFTGFPLSWRREKAGSFPYGPLCSYRQYLQRSGPVIIRYLLCKTCP